MDLDDYNFEGDGGQLDGWGLEICGSPVSSSDCNDYTVNMSPILNGICRSDNVLSSSGTVPQNGNVLFKSKHSVDLMKNYAVMNNATLEIHIEDCVGDN